MNESGQGQLGQLLPVASQARFGWFEAYGDKCMGILEAVGEVSPDAKYQRCTVHFYRNVFSSVPKSKIKIFLIDDLSSILRYDHYVLLTPPFRMC